MRIMLSVYENYSYRLAPTFWVSTAGIIWRDQNFKIWVAWEKMEPFHIETDCDQGRHFILICGGGSRRRSPRRGYRGTPPLPEAPAILTF